jgi:hypothetical protein
VSFNSVVQFLDQHAGVLALLALVAAWIIFRIDRWSERRGVLRGVEAELAMHALWVGNQYSEKDRGSWPNPDYTVFKLATVAIDNAIARGPSLFLNRDLSTSLIMYRQVVSHFNQWIDKLMAFQANPELWVKTPSPDLVKSAVQLIEALHIAGIGDASLQHPPAAYLHYVQVTNQLQRENDSKVLPLIWLVIGINLFGPKHQLATWIKSLTARIQRTFSPPQKSPAVE